MIIRPQKRPRDDGVLKMGPSPHHYPPSLRAFTTHPPPLNYLEDSICLENPRRNVTVRFSHGLLVALAMWRSLHPRQRAGQTTGEMRGNDETHT